MILAALITLSADFALPYAWLEHCATTPAARCEVAEITASDLAHINAVINATIRPRDDRIDSWQAFPADRAGDCDDVAVTKRAALLALGFRGPMRIVLGEAELETGDQIHAVLEVDIEGRTWILDSLAPDFIYEPHDRPYRWRLLARQSSGGVLWQIDPPAP